MKSIPASMDGLYQISLYKTAKGIMYRVPSPDNKGLNGLGDDLFYELEDAIKGAVRNRKLQTEQEERERVRKEKIKNELAAINAKKERNKCKTKLQILNEERELKIWNNWKSDVEHRIQNGWIPVKSIVTDTNATNKRQERYEYLCKIAFGCNENNPLVKERLQIKAAIVSGSIKKEEYHLENAERCYIVIPKTIYNKLTREVQNATI